MQLQSSPLEVTRLPNVYQHLSEASQGVSVDPEDDNVYHWKCSIKAAVSVPRNYCNVNSDRVSRYHYSQIALTKAAPTALTWCYPRIFPSRHLRLDFRLVLRQSQFTSLP